MKKLNIMTCRLLMAGLLAIFVSADMAAQDRQPSAIGDDYVFWGYPVTYLKFQAQIAYPLIDRVLQAYPPQVEVDMHRQLALITLDQFLHEAEYQRRDAFFTFFNSRMAGMLASMEQPALAGVRVYKLYNSGFILKTLYTTIAIDIVPGGETYKPFLTDSVINEIASRCNVLLITNQDKQHANKNVAKAFVDAGKQVITPKGLWTNLGENVLAVGADTTQIVELEKMTLHVLRGHNGDNQNNIYIMHFPGCGIVAHTGAQNNDADWTWIDKLHDKYKIDILLTKSQNINLESMLRGFQPRMVITSHENEMTGAVEERESYWTTQKRLKSLANLNIPNVIMTWGEAYDYADTESENISSSATKVIKDGVLYIERKGAVYTPTGIKVK